MGEAERGSTSGAMVSYSLLQSSIDWRWGFFGTSPQIPIIAGQRQNGLATDAVQTGICPARRQLPRGRGSVVDVVPSGLDRALLDRAAGFKHIILTSAWGVWRSTRKPEIVATRVDAITFTRLGAVVKGKKREHRTFQTTVSLCWLLAPRISYSLPVMTDILKRWGNEFSSSIELIAI